MDKIIIGVNQGKYTPTAGARTIVISGGLNFTPKIEQLAYVWNKTQDETYYAPAEKLGKVTLSGLTLTIDDTFDVLGANDVIHIQFWIDSEAYDINQDLDKINVENPEWAHYTSIEHIIDDTDATLDQHYSPEIQMEGYRNLILQLTGNTSTAGVVFTAFGTINPDAAIPADGDATPSADWVNVSTTILGAATITLNGGESDLFFVPDIAMLDRLIIRYDCDHVTNSTDIFIRRF